MNTTYTSNSRKHNDEWTVKRTHYSAMTTVKIALVNISLFAGAMATVYYIINNLL